MPRRDGTGPRGFGHEMGKAYGRACGGGFGRGNGRSCMSEWADESSRKERLETHKACLQERIRAIDKQIESL